MLETFDNNLNIVIFGSHGGIGEALVNHFHNNEKVSKIYSFSRSKTSFSSNKIIENKIDITDENSVKYASEKIAKNDKIDIIIIATGILHDDKGLTPEKSLRDINVENMVNSYKVNTVGPALIAKHFIPLLNRDRKTIFSAISARVSSISDNHLGGWYAYRASKTALNQILKTVSIEAGRKFKQTCVIGLHPGTVDTGLSEPFKANVSSDKLFTSEFASECLINVLDKVEPKDGGKLFDWEGKTIDY